MTARILKNFMLRAVALKGSALRFAAQALRADMQVVVAAVQQDPDAIRFAAPEMRAESHAICSGGDPTRHDWRITTCMKIKPVDELLYSR